MCITCNPISFGMPYGYCCRPAVYTPPIYGFMPFGCFYPPQAISSAAGYITGWNLGNLIFGRK